MAVGVLADCLKGLWFQISCLKFCGRGKSTTYTTVSNLAPRNSFVLPQESLSAADILILLGLQNMQCVVETITFSSYSNHKFSVSSTNLWYPSPPQAQASLSPPHSASLVSSSSRTASTFGRVTKCRSNCAQTAHSSCKYAICTSPANIRYAHWLPIELRRLDATSWPEYTSNKAQIAKTNFVQMVEYWQEEQCMYWLGHSVGLV